jgi:DNA-directed RNA polymerase sigma subunit (sigma70/sigma32)
MMEHEDVIKIPVNLKELQNKIKYAQTQLSQVSQGLNPQACEAHLKPHCANVCRFDTLQSVHSSSVRHSRVSVVLISAGLTHRKVHFTMC